MSDSTEQFKEEFGAILGKMTPEEIKAELESLGAEFENDKNMTTYTILLEGKQSGKLMNIEVNAKTEFDAEGLALRFYGANYYVLTVNKNK